MAQLSLDVSRWRMVRMALPLKRFQFAQIRVWSRNDQVRFDWLVANGFFVEAGDGLFELTDKGHAAADLGYYEWNPEPRVPEPGKPARKRGKK